MGWASVTPAAASGARKAALEVVTRVREREAYAHETLDAVLSAVRLDGRDAAFATRLAYGTVAARGTLDEAVARFVADPNRLEPRVGDALAVAAYELLYASTPPRAAVSQGVELVRSVQPKAAGLANAVLRRLAEATPDFPWGDPATDAAALARAYAHPRWLADLWVAELGRDDAEAVMAADNEPAPLYLAPLSQLSGDVAASEGLETSPCPLAGCLLAAEPAAARKSAAVKQRRVLVIDAAAQFAVHALRPRAGQRIVELGAGRGTKTLLAAELARGSGGPASIVAVDLHGFKLEALQRHARELGADEIETVTVDATGALPHDVLPAASADGVLVDAPCSGLGTLRRHPDRRWRARPAEIESVAALGEALLRTAASLVKAGGFVVYSTCTIARRENGDVVEGFLGSEAGKAFAVDRLDEEVPDEWRRFVSPQGWFQSLPEEGGPDGHFVVRLVRR